MSKALLVELFTEELPPKVLKLLGEAFAETLRGELTEAGSCGLQRLGVLIRERRDGDLSEGRTVFVKGWLLAETEAGLCGLLVGGRIA